MIRFYAQGYLQTSALSIYILSQVFFGLTYIYKGIFHVHKRKKIRKNCASCVWICMCTYLNPILPFNNTQAIYVHYTCTCVHIYTYTYYVCRKSCCMGRNLSRTQSNTWDNCSRNQFLYRCTHIRLSMSKSESAVPGPAAWPAVWVWVTFSIASLQPPTCFQTQLAVHGLSLSLLCLSLLLLGLLPKSKSFSLTHSCSSQLAFKLSLLYCLLHFQVGVWVLYPWNCCRLSLSLLCLGLLLLSLLSESESLSLTHSCSGQLTFKLSLLHRLLHFQVVN